MSHLQHKPTMSPPPLRPLLSPQLASSQCPNDSGKPKQLSLSWNSIFAKNERLVFVPGLLMISVAALGTELCLLCVQESIELGVKSALHSPQTCNA